MFVQEGDGETPIRRSGSLGRHLAARRQGARSFGLGAWFALFNNLRGLGIPRGSRLQSGWPLQQSVRALKQALPEL
jgi:hypothetical protein